MYVNPLHEYLFHYVNCYVENTYQGPHEWKFFFFFSFFKLVIVYVPHLHFSVPLLSVKQRALNYTLLLQAFLEYGIPESPEMVVALMRKVQTIQKLLSYCYSNNIFNLLSPEPKSI